MSNDLLRRFNAGFFAITLLSVAAGMVVGIAGIWGYVSMEDGRLWRMLGTCGAVFFAAMTASMAIAWFKANE